MVAKLKKETPNLRSEIISLRNSRKSIEDFNFNFLLNYHDSCELMHSHLSENDFSEKLVKTACRQYFVFLVGSWETFFRDLFVYVYSRDDNSLDYLITKMKVSESSYELNEITLPELLSKSFNFQNIKSIEDAYDSLWNEKFFPFVCQSKTDVCGLNGQITEKLSVEMLFPDWQDIIKKTFDIRHKVVHDANFRPEFNVDFIRKVEALFLLVPQLVTYFLAKRLGMKYVVLSDGKFNAPYIFSIHDILAKDWVIVE